MPLMQGDLLGHYKISAMIGKGGMGEVYRARDTKLAREVAIKVLPDTLAQHPDRLARLEREAKVLAALNHPNIAIIHGLEPGAIIMELVEGPTLADRLKSGPLPLEEALTISRQVAEALEAAHEKGVVHRDLKPANIKITLEGAVKVLDFGLATAVQGGDRDSADAANSPTLTMGATEAGVILGTAAYMSPEQASGKRVDKRSDIWSFGVVLWEILTGKPLFGEDETISHTLADVLRAEIDFTKLPASVAEPIRLLLRRCLTRDVRKRLRDIGEARIILENPESQRQISPRAESRPTRVRLLWPIAALLLLSMLAAVSFVHFREQPPTADVIRFQIPAPEKASLVAVPPIISPDGHKVVFLASDEGGRSRLWVRSVDALDARPLNVTEAGTSNSFWSPDSRFVAFAQENKLKRVDISGGPPQTVCDLPGPYRGGAWSGEGIIIFGTADSGLWRVPEAGGTPAPLTKLDPSRQESFHGVPAFLPDGRHFVYLRGSNRPDTVGFYIGSLDLKPEQQGSRRLIAGQGSAVYAPAWDPESLNATSSSNQGYLLFLRGGTLMAQRFDARRSELTSDAFPIAEGVGANFQNGWYSASTTGTLVYRTGQYARNLFTWFDRTGKNLGLAGEPGVYNVVSLSPDGTRAAIDRTDLLEGGGANQDVWVLDLTRNTPTRLTFDAARDGWPAWSPDGRLIAFSSNREGHFNLYRKDSSGAGAEELLLKSGQDKLLHDWSRDGHFLMYSQNSGNGQNEGLWVLPLEGIRNPCLTSKTSFSKSAGFRRTTALWRTAPTSPAGMKSTYSLFRIRPRASG